MRSPPLDVAAAREGAYTRSRSRSRRELLRVGLVLLGTASLLTLLASCSGAGGGGGPSLVDEQSDANRVGWALESAVLHAAPNWSTATWDGTVVQGYATGTATVTGSFTHNYDSWNGYKTETYTNVVIVFSDYSDMVDDPHLNGTVALSGTCATQYG